MMKDSHCKIMQFTRKLSKVTCHKHVFIFFKPPSCLLYAWLQAVLSQKMSLRMAELP